MWQLRQALTGGLTETMVQHTPVDELQRQQRRGPRCERLLKARPPVARTVDTMVGAIALERPYFYCRACRYGVYPLDEA